LPASSAILVLSLVARRGSFGAAVAVLGILTGVTGIVCEALRPIIGPAYLLHGLLLPTWFAFVGWNLLRLDLGSTRPREAA
jgi:hypothetical protein